MWRRADSGEKARVVWVASSMHFQIRQVPDFVDEAFKHANRYSGSHSYALAKLCNVMLAAETNKRYSADVEAVSVCPGMVRTNILRDFQGVLGALPKLLFWLLGRTSEIGARTLLWCVLSKDQSAVKAGAFHSDARPYEANRIANDDALRKTLWAFCEEMTN